MICKFFVLFAVCSTIGLTMRGLIGMESGGLHDHHMKVATSYMHFHGPVEGPAFEVKVPYVVPHHHEHHEHEHGHHEHMHGGDHHLGYTMDYVAHPKYEYKYGVEDYHSGDFHTQKETREGHKVTGEYTVLEPGGRYRTVKYHADKDGFHAEVHTTGKNEHHVPVHHVPVHHDHSQIHAISKHDEGQQEYKHYLFQ